MMTTDLKKKHAEAWEELAQKIATLEDQVEENPTTRPIKKGQLVILGSGIETLGFTLGDQQLIQQADKVFYCVSDPATAVWIREQRPDAFDLYVLYNDNKVRYITYMQMAEAQLYFVRQGLQVVVIFYGHPGIFVLSTHRAVKIAKREGHDALMKPAVSALDCLCADLGVEPANPGLQTHEATDIVVRKRQLDNSLHVVLWQVGLIGEMGYRRKGYLNSNFGVFLNYLEQFYGKDWLITHYIASKYPTIPPLIETYPLGMWYQPEINATLTGLSTFYIPPKQVLPIDQEIAVLFGMMQKGNQVTTPSSPLREIDRYGGREKKAFQDFRTFKVPENYYWQDVTGASKFLIALKQNPELQTLYQKDPWQLFKKKEFSFLSDQEKGFLARRESSFIQLAAKGLLGRPKRNRIFLEYLITKKSFCLEVLTILKNTQKNDWPTSIKNFTNTKNLDFDLPTFVKDLDYLSQHLFQFWTGVYPGDGFTVTVLAARHKKAKALVFLNSQKIRGVHFLDGVLSWAAQDGNQTNGFLRFHQTNPTHRQIFGKIWFSDQQIPLTDNFNATQRDYLSSWYQSRPKIQDIQMFVGDYKVWVSKSKNSEQLRVLSTGLSWNNNDVAPFQSDGKKMIWAGGTSKSESGEIFFQADPLANCVVVVGRRFPESNGQPLVFVGFGTNTPNFSKLGISTWIQAYPELLEIQEFAQNSIETGTFLWDRLERQFLINLVLQKLIIASRLIDTVKNGA